MLAEEARRGLRAALRGEGPPLRATALAPTARLMALAATVRPSERPVLVVTPTDSDARQLSHELADLLGADDGPRTLRLPALDADPYRQMPTHPAIAAERVGVLDRLATAEPVTVVLSARALLTPVPERRTVAKWGQDVKPGQKIDLEKLARRVVNEGYRIVDVVTAPGDFARRGGLFDIWPPHEESPLRVELWGDEVESIRRFEAASQRTVRREPGFRWLPAREAPIGPEQADRLLDRLVGRAREVLADAPATEEGLPHLIEHLLAGVEGAPRLYRNDLVALDALASSDVVVWEPEAALERLDEAWQDLERAHSETDGDALPAPRELYVPPERIHRLIREAPVVLSELAMSGPGERTPIDLTARPPRRYVERLAELTDDLRQWLYAGRPVVLMVRNPGRRMRLAEILDEASLSYRTLDEDSSWAPDAGELVVISGSFDEGVEFAGNGPLVLAEPDLFGADPPAPPPRKRRGGEAFLSDLRDLKAGDHVVHVDHGVGRYMGLDRRPGTGEELLVLEYAAGDRLFVPVSRLDLIQKYSGGDHALVPLDRLGGPGWDRRRRRVRKAVEEMARDLLDLSARRKTARSHAFTLESPWQEEFEQAFPHELTPDQSSALTDIKSDLETTEPMDRLLCGDVGYGKTEVALRCAFKVVQEGRQVAVLVPTTVLSFQHLTTFRARMAAWPVRVEVISRLVSAAEIKRILEATARGEVDILIGTHRLLSKDVRFKRLGLLVVDEEQRFGVRQKEAIKRLSVGVHVLSMSATPIPRTLQMSLAGVRNLSVIETPPRNRLAIQTHVAPWSPSLIAAAIRNELRRAGQVFFIHPRVQGIERVVAELRKLVPEAIIEHAHGQMPERQLERVMLAFIRGEIQVLTATTIIENGLDIPRANTILINQAHRFGLAQLYQMRGRVGRSDQRAYAYLLVPSMRELTAEARRRLAALVEFTELGAGFRIAALDLEIRGAGELLGARQSGHIAAVGFEMYVQMLEHAVGELRGQPRPAHPDPVSINLGVESYLPEQYVPEPGHRLEIYKRLSVAESPAEVSELYGETEDRFGRPPEPARNLFRLSELRIAATMQGAVSIDWAEDGVAVRYGERPQLDADRLVRLLQEDDGVRMTPSGVLRLALPEAGDDRISAATRALRRLIP
ncbi:MAG: transcription-repair coupling factor [Acidobacteriota bacterium]|nr:MAG: transcription-repair coupling factor [Acidobacteriota bacterium]